MKANDPIIFIDDDQDDCELLERILKRLAIPNPLVCFRTGETALEYLRATTDQPFLILCDINMPGMNGIELRMHIDRDEFLRRKSIPFVFYTTSATKDAINHAYDMYVQGFFQKGHSMKESEELILSIYNYWKVCRHPNE